eukprot:Phypoly_transcript_08575.p1 GENE.Phypoly_transcript_08575~~Phypoly_transcript_08575.p1  ORF type:complete len:287 (+),score=40.55 Phypoly_transcript_08575:576-1436(+)
MNIILLPIALGGAYLATRCPWAWKSAGKEMSAEKQERVKEVLRRVGYTDFTNVELRTFPADNNIIGIGGGNNSLLLIPPDFTASSNDSISSLYPSIPSHTLSNLTIGDLERQPELRDQLMRDYGIFVKTTKECDHLLGFSGTQMRNDDGAKLLSVQAPALVAIFFALNIIRLKQNAGKFKSVLWSFAPIPMLAGMYLINKKTVEIVHAASLKKTLDAMGRDTAEAAISVSKAEKDYNLLVRKKKEWFGGLFITKEGDDLLYPPTCSKRLEFIEKYLRETSAFNASA